MTQSERRRFPRVPNIVEIRYASDSPPLNARITDVSEGGLFVDAGHPLPPGAKVTFKFSIPGISAEPVVGEGKVVWHQHAVGMGIEFLDLPEEDRAKIRKFVFIRQ